MKAVCEGVNLSEAVMKVVKACAVRTTVPLLECIKIAAKNDELILSATDGDLAIIKKMKAEIYEEGETCVPGRYFADFIKKLEDVQITLAADGARARENPLFKPYKVDDGEFKPLSSVQREHIHSVGNHLGGILVGHQWNFRQRFDYPAARRDDGEDFHDDLDALFPDEKTKEAAHRMLSEL